MSSRVEFSEIATKRYALALFELGQENSELNEIETESQNLQDLLNDSWCTSASKSFFNLDFRC